MKSKIINVTLIGIIILLISAIGVVRIRDVQGDKSGDPSLRQKLINVDDSITNRYTKTQTDAELAKKVNVADSISTTFDYIVQSDPIAFATPAAGHIYYFGSLGSVGLSDNIANVRKRTAMAACSIVRWELAIRGSSAAASTENGSLYVRIKNTADSLLVNTVHWNGAYYTGFYSGTCDIPLALNDTYELKFVAPATWTTPPNSISLSIILYMKLK